MTTPSACSNCNTTGLAIHPVRYTVVPADIKPTLPPGISGARVKDVALDRSQYDYALRTLRGGFFYLFYEKGARGNNYWEVYSVAPEGRLMKQPDTLAARAIPDANCARQSHLAARTNYICIDHPEKCGTVWVAFSEHKWSPDAVAQYKNDKALRSKRMQAIEPAAWINGPTNPHAVEATQATLDHVLEYRPGMSASTLMPTVPGTISEEDGRHSVFKLKQQTTCYQVFMRNTAGASRSSPAGARTESSSTVKMMQISSERPDGKKVPPMLLALWDAVGTVNELNGYRNEVAGRVDQFSTERAVQIDAINLINNIKKDLPEHAAESQAARQKAMMDQEAEAWKNEGLSERRKYANLLPEPQRSQQLQIIALREQDQKDGIPPFMSQQREIANRFDEPVRSANLAKTDLELKRFAAARQKNAAANIDHARAAAAHDWPKYEEKLDQPALKLFQKNLAALNTEADTLLETRTVELIKWLEAPLFVDTLEDCHTGNIADGLEFEDKISTALFGISSSKAGIKKIEAWVNEGKATSKTNLVWRTIALNQKSCMAEVDAAIKEAKRHHLANTLASDFGLAAFVAKGLKGFADTYKKAQSITNSNISARAGTKAFNFGIQAVNTRNLDTIMIAFGDAIFRRFRFDHLMDSAAEHIISFMLHTRALVEPADSLALLKVTAQNNGVARADILRQMRTVRKAFETHPVVMRSVQADAVAKAWEDFRATNAKAPTAVKDARLAVIVILFESVNFFKMGSDCIAKHDAKSFAGLAASMMSITSALLDVSAIGVKEVLGSASWTYQKLKLGGGVLSGSATLIGAVFDFAAAREQSKNGEINLKYLYGVKALAGAAGGTLTLLTTVTYAAPLLERLTGRAAVGLAARSAGLWAGELIGERILMMSVGAWITVIVTSVQVAIYILTPDELQIWCEHCAFGTLRSSKSNATSVKSQRDALVLALKAVA